MPVFGERSRKKRGTCHPLLQHTADLAIRYWDITLIHGFRGKELQNELVAQGFSKTPWPTSFHNHLSTSKDVADGFAMAVGEPLSLAFDFAPWFPTLPHVRWKNGDEFYHMAGLIIGVSKRYLEDFGFRLRSGTDWDSDQDLHDQTFMDLGHLELRRL